MIDPGVQLLTVDLGTGVLAGFTTRAGGVSAGSWSGLNLALHVGDDPESVRRNRAMLAQRVGAGVAFARQVHGSTAELVPAGAAQDDLARTDLAGQRGCDALVATSTAPAVGVLVADCVPVLLADPLAGVVAAAHAGRVGLLGGVLASTVSRMCGAGARPARIRAALGPAAGPCCYEVPAAMQEQACATLPQLRARTTWGTPALDLLAGCRAALTAAGVGEVVAVGGCTIEDDAQYSYRRAAVTGRFAGVVRRLA